MSGPIYLILLYKVTHTFQDASILHDADNPFLYSSGSCYNNSIRIHITLTDQKALSNSIRLTQGGQKSITVEFSYEKIFEIETNDMEHWVNRAIRAKQTALDEEELLDFLNRVRYKTFGVFKVKTQLYLMTVCRQRILDLASIT